MTLIEQAAERLQLLRRAGVTTAANRTNADADPRAEAAPLSRAAPRPAEAVPISAHALPPKAATAARNVTVEVKRRAAQCCAVPASRCSTPIGGIRVTRRPPLPTASGLGIPPAKA